MRDEIFAEVKKLLDKDNSGHGIDHIQRVRDLSFRFAESEGADIEVVDLAALLHEVDDYKIFGIDSANNLTNAHRILEEFNIDSNKKHKIIEIIKAMGYNKYLENTRPTSLEGKVVSDADMCDSIGAQGILRTHAYNLSKGNSFFEKSLDPVAEVITASEYRSSKVTHSVQHFFDKLLRVSSIMLTESGKVEAQKRQEVMIEFLYQLFDEERSNVWRLHLDDFLNSK